MLHSKQQSHRYTTLSLRRGKGEVIFSNFVIINNAPAWINFDEGRVIMDGTTVHFTETHLRDHLGNTRVVFGYKNNALLVKQVNSYYPFGMNIKGLTTRISIEEAKHPTNEYLYNGKMFQDELGLDWLDYGARMYDAVLGRFHSPDIMASFQPGISPYSISFNNPILYVDYYGLGPLTKLLQKFITAVVRVFGYDTKGKMLPKKSGGGNFEVYRSPRGGGANSKKSSTNEDPTVSSIRNFEQINPIEPMIAHMQIPEAELAFKDQTPQPRPNYKGEIIEQGKPITFTSRIPFHERSDIYDLPATEKALSDLVKTLSDYPHLLVVICGNVRYSRVNEYTNINEVWNKSSSINGTSSTLGGLANARANAIRDYLESKGISGERIKAWRGNIYPDIRRGLSVSFEIREPK